MHKKVNFLSDFRSISLLSPFLTFTDSFDRWNGTGPPTVGKQRYVLTSSTGTVLVVCTKSEQASKKLAKKKKDTFFLYLKPKLKINLLALFIDITKVNSQCYSSQIVNTDLY